jgi:hypothetical protein
MLSISNSRGAVVCAVASFLVIGLVAADAQGANLIFRSGFEANSTPNSATALSDITGADNSVGSPNNWVTDLEGVATFAQRYNFVYVQGDATQRYIRIVDDPTGAGQGKILKFWLREAIKPAGGAATRCSSQLWGPAYPYKMREVYQRHKMYIHPDINLLKTYGTSDGGFYFQELLVRNFGANPGWTINPHIRLNGSLNFYWSIEADKAPSAGGEVNIWTITNTTVPVPIGEWFTMETYWKAGGGF